MSEAEYLREQVFTKEYLMHFIKTDHIFDDPKIFFSIAFIQIQFLFINLIYYEMNYLKENIRKHF